jgi:hypothetical protein
MSRYDRSQYFEALYRLKSGYGDSSAMDRRSEISIDDAIAYAEAVMAAFAAEEEEAQAVDAADASVAPQESTALGDPRD